MHATKQQYYLISKFVRTFAQLQQQIDFFTGAATANSYYQVAITSSTAATVGRSNHFVNVAPFRTTTTTAAASTLLQNTAKSSLISSANTSTSAFNFSSSTSSLTTTQKQRQLSAFQMPKHHHQLQRFYSRFTSATEPPNMGNKPICQQRAKDLVFSLKDSERDALKLALTLYDAQQQKEGFEGKLAATQWRTRFGRLTKVRPALGEVDPTGSYCAFPAGWLEKKAAQAARAPSTRDLWKLFFVNAAPFVVFGFLDNFTMIVAGDYIEYAFGYFMCISTMAAAGLGNTISDVLGIGSAFYVERGCALIGIKAPDLTPAQLDMKQSRRSANAGRIIGITVGCLLGMIPLLFRKDKKDDSKEIDKVNEQNAVVSKP